MLPVITLRDRTDKEGVLARSHSLGVLWIALLLQKRLDTVRKQRTVGEWEVTQEASRHQPACDH